MDVSLVSFSVWQNLLVALALILGAEAAYLLFVASRNARPSRERALALIPAGAFVWVPLAARSVRAAHDNWQRYIAFQITHYEPHYYLLMSAQDRQEMAPALASANRMGWIALALIAAMIALSVALLARWSGTSWALRGRSVEATTATLPGNELEITVEPLERPHGER